MGFVNRLFSTTIQQMNKEGKDNKIFGRISLTGYYPPFKDK